MKSQPVNLIWLALAGVAAGGFVIAVTMIDRLRDAGPRKRSAHWARRGDLSTLRVKEPRAGRITLGRHGRALIAAEERASVLVVGPTQSGKTTGLVIPAMREWAGPVVATSVKTDLLQATLAARSELGEARVFDPTQSTTLSHAVWSPLAASTTWTGARRTAAALLGVADGASSHSADDAFWRPAGARYLAALLFAASQAANMTMADVLHWIAISDFSEPIDILSDAPAGTPTPALDSVTSVRDADPRFTSSLLQTIATALDAWQEPQVAGATMGESKLSADWLFSGANTLYIVAPANDQRRLSGLFAALITHLVAGAYERSAKTGKPIEPALLLALDEVANIAPLPNLDEIASTGPGQGVHLLCVLQNISQGYDRWGRDRAETIIANHRARLFCSGIGDRATLDYLKNILGDEEIARISTQRRGLSQGGRTRSTEHRPLAAPDQVRQAGRSSSLLVYGRLAPAWITLRSGKQR
ncbi:type IV secretory system conjugative DNA transfer family protein [Conexibacter sp. DBS9H8]|uniref:type IV secretory system conjugative DNA transfer family protein n=1 Tax=Conexibacter sp. DBS9H8 TaxID=2937801 RepID=UPI00200C51CE|nr:type IV secretory system conjugative DNA transfer family protein [Conexibacter sp. DBS9H8]